MKSIKENGQSKQIIQRSEFIGYALNVSSKQDIDEHLNRIRSVHPKANHVVVSYVLGMMQEVQKYDDDKEPSMSAGYPILEAILNHDLTNVCVVVVRYFGGILLGKGGLIRAYRSTAEEAISNARLSTHIKKQSLLISIPFDEIGHTEQWLRENTELQETLYSEHVTYRVYVKAHVVEQVINELTDRTKGSASFVKESLIDVFE